MLTHVAIARQAFVTTSMPSSLVTAAILLYCLVSDVQPYIQARCVSHLAGREISWQSSDTYSPEPPVSQRCYTFLLLCFCSAFARGLRTAGHTYMVPVDHRKSRDKERLYSSPVHVQAVAPCREAFVDKQQNSISM